MASNTELPVREKDASNGESNRAVNNPNRSFGRELRKDFLFDQDYLNLNHGSFGTYPLPILSVLHSFQSKAEARPDAFIRYEYPTHLDASRAAIASFLHAPVESVVFVPNATTGINTVLRSLTFAAGDVIVYFATIYGACGKSVAYITETTPARAVKIEYTYPVEDDWLVGEFERVVRAEQDAGRRVRVAIFDTVVSLPGVRMPFERLAEKCRELGVLSCVDGAHGAGHVELDLSKLDFDFFVSNCHKWLFVPRGCAVFYVPVRNQHLVRSTLPTSHGFVPLPQPGGQKFHNPLPASTKSPYITNFEFVGTIDNSPYLCIPAGLEYRESLGGEAAIREYCFSLAREAGSKVAEMLGTEVLENKGGTLGECCFTNVRLPLDIGKVVGLAKAKGSGDDDDLGTVVRDWLTMVMIREYGTFMALIFYAEAWWVRLSAQVYLDLEDFEWAAGVLKKVCERVGEGEFLDK